MAVSPLHAYTVDSLRLALAFVEDGSDGREFLRRRLSEYDGGAWVRAAPLVDPMLRMEARTLLLALIDGRESEMPVAVNFEVRRHGKRVVVARSGTPRDLFLYALVQAVQTVGLETLRVCRAADRRVAGGVCGRLFLRVTNKEHCSTRCQSREYMRNTRANQANRLKKRSSHVKTR